MHGLREHRRRRAPRRAPPQRGAAQGRRAVDGRPAGQPGPGVALDGIADEDRYLLWLFESEVTASFPVEVWRRPRVPDSGASVIDVTVEHGPLRDDQVMATHVLVHGGGSGGWCYQRVARRLRAEGHEVHAPSLTGLGDRPHPLGPHVVLRLHARDIAALIGSEDLRDVIRLGHEVAEA